MRELVKVERYGFENYYEGIVGNRKVVCILDNNCVRWSVCRKARTIWKQESRHEYSNSQKAVCFEKATNALNKLS